MTIRPFSSRTRVALAIARSIAAARGDTDVSPTHIVLGILSEGKNFAIGALQCEGIDVNRVRGELDRSLGHPPGHVEPRKVALDLTPGEEKIVRLAEGEAESMSDEYLGAQHLLLAIIRDSASPATQLLAAHGISVERLERGLMTARQGPPT